MVGTLNVVDDTIYRPTENREQRTDEAVVLPKTKKLVCMYGTLSSFVDEQNKQEIL